MQKGLLPIVAKVEAHQPKLFETADILPITPQDYVRNEASKYGWSEGYQWQALNTLIMNESGWRANVRNQSSGACGLFQALPCSKLGAPLENVSNQAKWGLEYISGYGSPSQALSFWSCVGNCYSTRTNSYVYKSTTWY